MNDALTASRLCRPRGGFDIAIERLYRAKARRGLPLVVSSPQGTPVLVSARKALKRLEASKA